MGDSESDELDDLLESALEDYQKLEKEKEEKTRTQPPITTTTLPFTFNNPFPSSSSHTPYHALNTTANSQTTSSTTTTTTTSSSSSSNALPNEDDDTNEDDIAKQFAEEVSKIMSDLKEGKIDHLLQQINMPTESGVPLEDGDSNAGGFEQNLTSTLSSLANEIKPDSNKLPEMGDDYLDKLQGGLENLVEQLISKDVLYEPMKELREKYPPWLESHKDKLTEEEFAKYNKQYECVQKICVMFESDQNNLQVIQLVQEMSEFGQPPPEIMEELAPGVKFGTDGLPILPDDSNNNDNDNENNNNSNSNSSNNNNTPQFNPENCVIM